MHLVYVDILAHSTYLVGIAGEVVSKKGAQAQGQRPQRGRLRRAEFELCVWNESGRIVKARASTAAIHGAV